MIVVAKFMQQTGENRGAPSEPGNGVVFGVENHGTDDGRPVASPAWPPGWILL